LTGSVRLSFLGVGLVLFLGMVFLPASQMRRQITVAIAAIAAYEELPIMLGGLDDPYATLGMTLPFFGLAFQIYRAKQPVGAAVFLLASATVALRSILVLARSNSNTYVAWQPSIHSVLVVVAATFIFVLLVITGFRRLNGGGAS
jgi:hypothetical protein